MMLDQFLHDSGQRQASAQTRQQPAERAYLPTEQSGPALGEFLRHGLGPTTLLRQNVGLVAFCARPMPEIAESHMPDLIVDHIRKEFPTRGEPLIVLDEASFELSAGENMAIVGPSGSGKSTLLHIIGALDSPTSGTVTLDGENPFTLDEPQLAAFRNRNIGFIFQDHHLLPQLSVLENVLIPTIANGPADQASIDRANDLLDRVGLADRVQHRPAELSGGERQRVGVARALIRQPKLLLADEPTGNLDQTNARAIGNLMLELQQQENTMLVVVTHSVELADLLQRQMKLDDGRLTGGGASAD